jgi:hypothetical protein
MPRVLYTAPKAPVFCSHGLTTYSQPEIQVQGTRAEAFSNIHLTSDMGRAAHNMLGIGTQR